MQLHIHGKLMNHKYELFGVDIEDAFDECDNLNGVHISLIMLT